MKILSSILLASFFIAIQLQAQDLFEGFGTKGYLNKISKEQDAVVIPQLSISFDTYKEKKVVATESKLSKMQNTFSAMSKGSQYGGSARGSAMTVTILDTDMQLEDFQELANSFQQILEEEIANAGVKTIALKEFAKTESYSKLAEKYAEKTVDKGKKNSEENIGKGQIRIFPENSLFLFDEKSLVKGGGVSFITMLRGIIKETEAVLLLQNLDINFSTVELDVDVSAGVKRSVTEAQTKVLPKMSISRNVFDFLGKNGPGAYAALKEDYVSSKEYKARIYQDKEKGKSMLEKMFSLKGATIEFDPYIVEMDKNTYKTAATELFRQYAKDFAKVYGSIK